MTRGRQVRQLAPALLRSVRWQPVAVAAVGAAALLGVRRDHLAEPSEALVLLRLVGLLLAVGLAFALDDPCRLTVAGAPTPRWWRVAVQVLVALVPAGVVWLAVLGWATQRAGADLPVAALSLEAATLAALSLAGAAGLAGATGLPDPGAVVGPVLLVGGLLAAGLPEPVALLVAPGPDWRAGHERWAVLLVAGLAVLALAVRDPASRRWLRPRGGLRSR